MNKNLVLFSFSDVDNNADYDGLEQLSRDAEDKYFNDDNSDTSDVRSQSAAEYDFWSAYILTVASLICILNNQWLCVVCNKNLTTKTVYSFETHFSLNCSLYNL